MQVIVAYWLGMIGLGLYIWKGNWEEKPDQESDHVAALAVATPPPLNDAKVSTAITSSEAVKQKDAKF